MDPRSCYVSCFGTTLANSPPSFSVGLYDTEFHTRSCGLCRLGKVVLEKVKLIKGLEL